MTEVKLTKTDRKLLRRIRDMVAATHWGKGEYFRQGRAADEYYGPDKDTYCLVGFVNKVTGLSVEEGDIYLGSDATTLSHYDSVRDEYVESKMPRSRVRLIAALKAAIAVKAPRARSIEEFNDRRSTTRKDILEVLDLTLGDKGDRS